MPSLLPYQALLLVSFGGPDGPEDVLPFLENVTRGRNVPKARLEAVRRNYDFLGGKSPINEQNRALIVSLEKEFSRRGIDLPIYFGNRNWQPYLHDAIAEMKGADIKKALAFVTSSMASYSGCRQYLDNIVEARRKVGPEAPEIHKIRIFYNHPLFIQAVSERIIEALKHLSQETHLVFTAHSIPLSMARGCDYEKQFKESARLVAETLRTALWSIAYQSRSGPPEIPWLRPTLEERCEVLQREGVKEVLIVPLGFLSDHVEILYDLDHTARTQIEALGLKYHRTPTVGTHPKFVEMICELVEERLHPERMHRALGHDAPAPDYCPEDCCPVG